MLERVVHGLPTMVSALIGCACLLTGTSSRADTAVGVDLELAYPTSEAVGNGAGVGVRLGQRADLELIVLTGEAGLSYHSFGGTGSPAAYRGVAGGRLAIGALLRAFVFAHLGLGHASYDAPADATHTAFTYDGGGGLAFTLLPLMNIGAHVGYANVLANDVADDLDWINVGADIEFVF